MFGLGHSPAIALTPKNRFRPQADPSAGRTDDSGWSLNLKFISGTTSSSSNAFSCDSKHHKIAYCAGSAAIVCSVDEKFHISQRLYRARPNAVPINPTQSFYNPSTPPTTPSKSRRASPIKDGATRGSTELGSDSPVSVSSGSRAGALHREATCLSLSDNGKFLVVGEVIHPIFRW